MEITSGSERIKKAMQCILSDFFDRVTTKKKIYIYFFLCWAVNTQVLALN